jgi:hypothetical protein
LEAGSVPPNLNFPQLDFVEPSSGFHPVTWERVILSIVDYFTLYYFWQFKAMLIYGYWWILMDILLMVMGSYFISGYFINGY